MIERNLNSSLYEASRFFIQTLKTRPQADQEECMVAFFAAAQYHGEQKRKSGPLYIIHPIQVASIVAYFDADVATICAALLHDVLEDTSISSTSLEQRFGNEVYQLVEAVTQQKMFSRKEFQEKVYAKSRRDPRVALIKIADRLTNLPFYYPAFPLEHLEKVLQETQEYYLGQLAVIPGLPKELTKALERVLAQQQEVYTALSKAT